MQLHADGGRRVGWWSSLFALAVLLCVWTAEAQDLQHAEVVNAQAAHASRLARNPAGLSLAIRAERGTLRFAQGELITLELEFRDDTGDRHPFHAIAYDRSGRLGIDRVIAAPTSGVEDPLRDYYRALGLGVLGGGLSAPPAPLDGPRTLSLDLNEQLRFVRQGVYAVYVESHRFLDGRVNGTSRRDPLVVVSNLLTLEITAPPSAVPPPTMLSSRALRFADSPQAAQELARRLLVLEGEVTRVGTDGHDIRFGLLGTPYRAEALAVLRDGLATASRAVNAAVPAVAAFLDVMNVMPRGADEDDPTVAEGAARLRARSSRYACQLSFWQRQALAAGLRGDSSDVARASVAFTDDVPPHCPPAPPVDVARVLPPVFDRLPSAQQRLMLSYRWGHVAGPAMLPVLRQLVSAAAVESEVRDAALVRLGELAPAEAAGVSRQDVISGRFRFSAQALRLGPADIGAVTLALAGHLARAREGSTPLSDLQDGQGAAARGLLPTAVRFPTRPACDTLGDWPRPGPVPCAARASVIACTLAVDENRGARWLREALRDARSRCGDDLPDTLARLWPQRLPEGLIIDALWEERSSVAASAARALARIGTDKARAALWRRLEAWHARWAARQDDLRLMTPTVVEPLAQELELERALREALLRGRGWLTTASDRLRVRDSCVTPTCREEFSPFRSGPPARLVLVQAEEWTGQTVYRIDGHAYHGLGDVIDRLVLYPKTVTIAWRAGNSHAPARASELYETLASAALIRGLTIRAQPPPLMP